MALIGTVPRRSVNLPPGSLGTLVGSVLGGKVQEGPAREEFRREFASWLGVSHVFGASTGRAAFQLALEALAMEKGKEIVFPAFTFPVMPMVAKLLGYVPVFCDVDPETFNSGPEHVEAVLTENTAAVLATHLFGQPCPIREIAELAKSRGIRLLEDCAHGLGVRVGGRQVGTFGDIGVFSFAEGKNMPCFGGGAISVMDDEVAERAARVLESSEMPSASDIRSKAFSIWVKWLFTRPLVFGLTAYQALRWKLITGKPLMDSAVGNELVKKYLASNPAIGGFSNLQSAIGIRQLRHIDAFNEGARRNAAVLTEAMGEVPGVKSPKTDGDHIFVYYPLVVDPDKRDDLRHHLLRHGVDTKRTDMADCAALEPFRRADGSAAGGTTTEASILEVCVYPVLSERQMQRIEDRPSHSLVGRASRPMR
jgi:dTDP-4-amino-4,6-dideoxygalactose transaminase